MATIPKIMGVLADLGSNAKVDPESKGAVTSARQGGLSAMEDRMFPAPPKKRHTIFRGDVLRDAYLSAIPGLLKSLM